LLLLRSLYLPEETVPSPFSPRSVDNTLMGVYTAFSMNSQSFSDRERTSEIEQQILRAVKSIRYGSVEIIIHDSKVVQIDRKEKIRLDKSGVKDD
jgi:hypothetical protein